MAEARAEGEEDGLRESRGGAGRNQRRTDGASERAERNKPEQRPTTSSQGALSSIRAVIKRTSNRPTTQADPRDRRRPEITILSAEPLVTNNWLPGASGVFPPPPPPAQPSWASGGLTVQLPPPSYEQVIREKSREQSIQSSSVSSSSSSPPTPRRSTVTIATQTDTDPSSSQAHIGPSTRRPPKPPRPSFPLIPKPADSASASSLIEIDEPDLTCTTHTPVATHGSDILSTPLSEQCGVQTDFSNIPDDLAPLEATPSSDIFSITSDPLLQPPVKRELSARPRPRPRSKAILHPFIKEETLDQPMTREVKVQTLVRLKDDGTESVFAGFTDSPSELSSNKYLQELLDAFCYDEQGFQDNKLSESDQSEKSEEEEEEEKAASESCFASVTPLQQLEPSKRPEPKPRSLNPKPTIAPEPSKPMCKGAETSVQTSSPPVPAPRPLLTKKSSEGSKPETDRFPRRCRPPVAARRSVVPTQAEEPPSRHQTSPVPPKSFVDEQNKDNQGLNSSPAPGKPVPVNLDSRSSRKGPLEPTQTQFPAKPPSRRKPPPASTKAQLKPRNAETKESITDGGVSVNKTPASSVPLLQPRTSADRLLPLRPPPVKLPKSAGSSHVPATASKLPAHRVPKRGPPLPPRPKPGHPLYRDSTSKVPQENTRKIHPGTEPEEEKRQQEELLLVLDDTPAATQMTIFSREEKSQVQDVRGDVCTAVSDEHISPQIQEGKREWQKGQQQKPNTDIRHVARFGFEGRDRELTFCEGDVITLIEYVNEEWGRGSLNGLAGLFPLNFVQEDPSSLGKPAAESPAPTACEAKSPSGRALFDFTPESEDELCLKVGDIVCCLEDVDEEWFSGEVAGKRGIVPKNYIQVL